MSVCQLAENCSQAGWLEAKRLELHNIYEVWVSKHQNIASLSDYSIRSASSIHGIGTESRAGLIMMKY